MGRGQGLLVLKAVGTLAACSFLCSDVVYDGTEGAVGLEMHTSSTNVTTETRQTEALQSLDTFGVLVGARHSARC